LHRYTLGVIALALMLWAVWHWTQDKAREPTSPWKVVGLAEPHRWRSLSRWTRKVELLFGFEPEPANTTRKAVAHRIVRLLIPRGPPNLCEHERVFVGAQAR
jgi:hypothetical protein